MKISGMMIYYYFVCKRKLWYYINQLNMEQNSELVAIGKILDENSYKREKKGILIDETINVDFIKNGAVLHEVKKTRSIEQAGLWQLKYYMYYLENKGIQNISAIIDYPLIKETKNVFLGDDDRKTLKKVINDIEKISKYDRPPEILNNSICKNVHILIYVIFRRYL